MFMEPLRKKTTFYLTDPEYSEKKHKILSNIKIIRSFYEKWADGEDIDIKKAEILNESLKEIEENIDTVDST